MWGRRGEGGVGRGRGVWGVWGRREGVCVWVGGGGRRVGWGGGGRGGGADVEHCTCVYPYMHADMQ